MKLHHIGFVVSDIDKYISKFPPMRIVKRLEDSYQNAELVLLEDKGGMNIELIKPMNTNSFTMNFLTKFGEGFHHLCFESDSLTDIKTHISEKKLKKILGPVYAPLLNGEVIFAIDRTMQITEFLIRAK